MHEFGFHLKALVLFQVCIVCAMMVEPSHRDDVDDGRTFTLLLYLYAVFYYF
jgi:hypothetical protein